MRTYPKSSAEGQVEAILARVGTFCDSFLHTVTSISPRKEKDEIEGQQNSRVIVGLVNLYFDCFCVNTVAVDGPPGKLKCCVAHRPFPPVQRIFFAYHIDGTKWKF